MAKPEKELTPMQRQYQQIKEQNQGAVPQVFPIAAIFLPQTGNRQIHELPPKDDGNIIESQGDKVNGGKKGKSFRAIAFHNFFWYYGTREPLNKSSAAEQRIFCSDSAV